MRATGDDIADNVVVNGRARATEVDAHRHNVAYAGRDVVKGVAVNGLNGAPPSVS